MYEREEKCIQNLAEKPEGNRRLGIPKCRWRIMLKWILKKWDGRVRISIILAEDSDQWRAVVNTVMILRVP
jgi:hypothetical protein